MTRDLRVALRRLRKAPAFTAFAVVTLAAGIGIATAAYSFIYGVARLDPGVRDRASLVEVSQGRRAVVYESRFSWPEVTDVAAVQTVFSELGAWTDFSAALADAAGSHIAAGQAVSGNLFNLLGVNAAPGRVIQPRDDRADAPGVVVLSDTTWRKQFRADPRVIGTSVRMAGRVFEVVGVAPPAFRGLAIRGGAISVWAPLATAPLPSGGSTAGRLDIGDRERRVLTILGRLKPARTIDDAKADARLVAIRLDTTEPMSTIRGDARVVTARRAFDNSRLLSSLKTGALFILSLPALVLLVACTNLANLVLSRGVSRRHEFAVRRALGGSRWRMVREQLVEGAIVAVAGGAAGVLAANRLLAYASAIADDVLGGLPEMQIEPRLEPAVFIAAGGLALLALLVSSLLPALQLTRIGDRQTLSADTGIGVVPRWRGRSNLIAIQVTVSVALFLLTALGVTVLTFDTTRDARAGLDRIAVVSVPFSRQQVDEARVRRTLDRLIEQTRAVPGVAAVEIATLPAAGSRSHESAYLASTLRPFGPNGTSAQYAWVVASTPGIFRLLGTTVRAGRAFDDRDGPGAPPVAVINRKLALTMFGTRDAAGRDLLVRTMASDATTTSVRVVGVVEDTANSDGRVTDELYVPYAQHFGPDVVILAKGETDVAGLITMMRTTLHQIDPDVAVGYSGRADVALAGFGYRILSLVTGASASLAVIALVLSMTGLYGVLSHVVSRRTRELGLRMALGADEGRIMRLILKDGFRPILEGLVIGLCVAAILRLLLQPSFDKTITAFDPIAFAFAAGPLLLAGAVACYLPARRAARVQPNVALRDL
jgi:putative ABC transport system permease protein